MCLQASNVFLRIAPRQEVHLGLRSAWVAYLIMENGGRSKEATVDEVLSLLEAQA